MRFLALTGLMMASIALFACQASSPPQSASVPEPAFVQKVQPAPSAAESAPSVAELPPAFTDAPSSSDANGPPLNILKPPR
jgi:hypothetical protein